MSFKTKIMKSISSHPRLAIFGIGLAITFVVGTVIGMISPEQVSAANGHCGNC